MRIGTTRGAMAAILALCGAVLAGAAQAASNDPDWPCIQRKVPHISPGMLWAGPAVDEADEAWRKDPAVRDLVINIAARTTGIEDAAAAIETFAAGLGADKDRALTALFTGTLATINSERDSIIQGIARYARRQQALAKKIEAVTADFNALPADATAADKARRDDLRQQIDWDTRIFEERERSLTYVCEQPVLLEQRAFALARAIMGYLD